MGRLDTPFYEEGVLRLLCFYPMNGVMRRKIITQSQQPVNPAIHLATLQQYPRYNQQQASYDRVFHFEVEAGPEGAILSGRFCPIEAIGEGSIEDMQNGITESIFEMILEQIRKGGAPLRHFPGTSFALPKWNQFWSTTSDGWIFGGNDPPPGGVPPTPVDPGGITGGGLTDMIQQPVSAASNAQAGGALVTVGGQPVQTHTVTVTKPSFANEPGMGNTQVQFENEKASMAEILHAPQPSYNDEHDEEFGFIGGA